MTIEVKNIHKRFGDFTALDDVSLQFPDGALTALLGPSGCGKTTLLRIIAGLEKPSAGSVTFDDRDITGIRAEQLAGQGLVLIPGGRAVFTDMTVAENLEMQSLSIRKQGALVRERKERVLSTFPRLAERMTQLAGTLSGGEQQQLGLAKALMLDPQVLCIDELSLGLAPVVIGELMEIVGQLNESGITLVVVEQSLNIAAQLCSRAIFLEKGEVRFAGECAELLEKDDIARAVFFGSSG